MCVISIVEDKRPTEAQVLAMWNQNSHGGGVAWREGNLVHWKKGLKLEDMQDFTKNLPMPFILHFRVASIGGIKPILTHPFAVEDFDKSLELEGTTKGGVMFHNGHWNSWFDRLATSCGVLHKPIPLGVYSDSRAMAYLAKLHGQGFLDALNEKTVTLSPNRIDITVGGGWIKIDDIWYSNDYWESKTHGSVWKPMCLAHSCLDKENLDSAGYCPKHKRDKVVNINTGTQTGRPGPAAHNGMGSAVLPTQSQALIGGGRTVDPFDPREQLLQAELAWSLYASKLIPKAEAQACCSKSKLKNLRKQVAKLGQKLGKKQKTQGLAPH